MNTFGATGIIIGITNIAIGLLVYSYNRKSLNNQLWLLFAVSVSIWGFGSYVISISKDPTTALLWWNITHVGIILIPFSFVVFARSFLERKSTIVNYFAVIMSALFIILVLSGKLIDSVRLVFGSFYYDGPPTIYYSIFVISFILTIIYTLVYSLTVYLKTTDQSRKRQIIFFIIASFIGSAGGSTSFLPVYGIYVYPYLNACIVLFPFIIGYAILRHGLFNLKAIATELFVFCLWLFILLRAILSNNFQDVIINAALLILLIFIGIFLIRSVRKEVNQREKIQKLADDLTRANSRLMDLDRQKSEFVSFATHQLRAPLTAMKGYSSLILEGEMGKVSKAVNEAVSRIFDSSKTLANVVDDYLNISRIELGTMKYSFDIINMKEFVENIIAELKPNIEKTGIAWRFTTTPSEPNERFMIHADRDKLKQVITNIIDNSLKYTPKGNIDVSIVKNLQNRKITFSVKDTGVGIAPEVMPRLFAKFIRAENANKQNIYGTGLGLFVAKEIVTAHKGRLWAESDGEGKGSTFFLELDMEV